MLTAAKLERLCTKEALPKRILRPSLLEYPHYCRNQHCPTFERAEQALAIAPSLREQLGPPFARAFIKADTVRASTGLVIRIRPPVANSISIEPAGSDVAAI